MHGLSAADLSRIEALARGLDAAPCFAHGGGCATDADFAYIAALDPDTVLALVEAARAAEPLRAYLRGLLGREPTAAEMVCCAETLAGSAPAPL